MELKLGEHYQERATGRRYVLLNLTEHTNDTWVAFENLESRVGHTVKAGQFLRDFEQVAT